MRLATGTQSARRVPESLVVASIAVNEDIDFSVYRALTNHQLVFGSPVAAMFPTQCEDLTVTRRFLSASNSMDVSLNSITCESYKSFG